MRKPTWGPIVKERAKRLLKVLLLRNAELYDHTKWEEEDNANPKLIVKTNRRTLEKLAQLTKYEFYEVIACFKALEILEDRRFNKQGTKDWYFALKLWNRDTTKNLSQFDQVWEKKRPEKSKNRSLG